MTAKRTNPEAKLQIDIKNYLSVVLPPSIFWTASLTGTNLSIRAATKAKAMGVRRGLPDLCFVFPDGITRFIELKAPKGSLTPEQQAFRDLCSKSGRDIFAVCRSVEEVDATLRGWGASLRSHPFYPELAA